MKRIAVVFLISILIPALLLAALAIRSVRDQEVVINTQKVLVHQSTCDAIVSDINLFLDDVRVFYSQTVDELAGEKGVSMVPEFNEMITEKWAQAAVGAVVSESGVVLSPEPGSGDKAERFLDDHAAFLGNDREVEVYQAPQVLNNQLQVIEQKAITREPESKPLFDGFLKKRSSAPPVAETEVASSNRAPQALEESAESPPLAKAASAPPQAAAAPVKKQVAVRKKEESSLWTVSPLPNKLRESKFGVRQDQAESADAAIMEDTIPAADRPADGSVIGNDIVDDLSSSSQGAQIRNVSPVQSFPRQQEEAGAFGGIQFDNRSRLNRVAVNLTDLSMEESEGAVSRLIDGGLHILLWKRPSSLPGYTFWTELNLDAIQQDLGGFFEKKNLPGTEEVSFALLNSDGAPVALTEAGFSTDWSLPFVASEVGQILPRWEVAAYLLNPAAMTESARTVRLTLWLIVVVLVGAVGIGCLLILKSVNYEMRLATRKTDFVSNVSHELKTPLTSIRMFSELLAGTKEYDPDQTRKYSEVISKESARLTRLINRLLDFSRLDRGEMRLQNERIDLGLLAEETAEMYRAGAETGGWNIEVDADSGVELLGDRDALSQVILNLLSNAEKYAPDGGGALVEVKREGEFVRLGVHDRGPGISRAHQRNIFDKFYRIDDSIDSGVEGSGIGLALSRQIVERLGGTIHYEKRDGGGSSFLARFPRATTS